MSDNDCLLLGLAGTFTDVVGPDGKQMLTPVVSTNQPVKRRSKSFLVSDAATAGTAVTELCVGRADSPGGAKIISVTVAAPIAVTAVDANFATFTLSKRTAGGAATICATQTTKTSGSGGVGNMAAFVDTALTLQAAAAITLASGDTMTFLISKGGTGVALTAATSQVGVTVVYEEV